jgi:hypothetical protein
MMRASLGRAALRLYPTEIRAARGEELLGTLLDAGEHSWLAFARELWSVVLGAWLARARVAAGEPAVRIASDTLRWCAVIALGMDLFGLVAEEVHWFNSSIPIAYNTVCPAVIIVMFLLGLDRAAGLGGVAFCVYDATRHPLAPTYLRVEELVLIAGFGLMTVASRRRAGDLRLLLLVPVLAEFFFRWTEIGLLRHGHVGYMLPAIAAALLLPIKPCAALATGLALALLAPYYLPGFTNVGIGFLCCTPVAIILVGLSRYALAE